MLKVALLVLGGTALVLSFTLPNSDSEKVPIAPHISFIGKVGLKSYYVDNNYVNWTEAIDFCEGMGMKLATIETADEFDFLSNAYTPEVFDMFYWVAARDSHKLSQLEWNESGTPLNLTVDVVLHNDIQPSLTCGAVFSRPTRPLEFYMLPCSYKRADVRTLCDVKSNMTDTTA